MVILKKCLFTKRKKKVKKSKWQKIDKNKSQFANKQNIP